MDYRELLSGQRRDPLAIGLRGMLRLAEYPYSWAVAVRNRGFDLGSREILRCGVPVISIGNLTTGGTGKTPLVCFIARHLRQRGLRVSIVSRGYGAEAGIENDEALELARELPDVPHVQDADRVEAARIAVEELETEAILMDDGFQHRRLARDLDLVVIDATNPFGFNHLLPRGLLREPLTALRRADAFVLSRADLVTPQIRQQIQCEVRRYAPQAIWAEATHQPTSLLTWPHTKRSIECLAGRRVALLAAIGNPTAFCDTVRGCGAEIMGTKFFPDHHPYSRETVEEISAWLKTLDDASIMVVCTHKDLVKLQTDRLAGQEVGAVIVELRLTVGAAELLHRVNQASSTSNLASDNFA